MQDQNKIWAKCLISYQDGSKRVYSTIGRGVRWGKDLLDKGTISLVMNDNNTLFWTDNWTGLGPLTSIIQGPLNRNDHLMVVNQVALDLGKWDWERISFNLPLTIQHILNAIPCLKNSLTQDKKIWSLNSEGIIDLQSAYLLSLRSKETQAPQPASNKWIWKLHCHARQKVFIWALFFNAIPNRVNLKRRGLSVPITCPLCNGDVESLNHLFRDCAPVREVWRLTKSNTDLDRDHEFQPWLKQTVTNHSQAHLDIPSGTLAVFTIWHIWKARNNLFFKQKNLVPTLVAKRAIASAAEFHFLTDNKNRSMSQDTRLVRWKPPPEGWLKLNTDGSSSNDLFSVAGVIRDSVGNWIYGFSEFVGRGNSLKAEIWAICRGIIAARSLSCSHLIIETDSTVAKSLILDINTPTTHHLFPIIVLCRENTQGLTRLEFNHTLREGNYCADFLAKKAFLDRSSYTVFAKVPPGVSIYLEPLAIALDHENWSLIQFLMSSSYTGYGTSSLQQDAKELDQLINYLINKEDSEGVVLLGHSTGCQDIIHFMSTNVACTRAVRAAIFQAPVSDREYMATLPETASMIDLAANMIKEGRGSELMPRKANPNCPITAYRYNSLSSYNGDDDLFSSDLSDEQLKMRLGHICTTTNKDMHKVYSSLLGPPTSSLPANVNANAMDDAVIKTCTLILNFKLEIRHDDSYWTLGHIPHHWKPLTAIPRACMLELNLQFLKHNRQILFLLSSKDSNFGLGYRASSSVLVLDFSDAGEALVLFGMVVVWSIDACTISNFILAWRSRQDYLSVKVRFPLAKGHRLSWISSELEPNLTSNLLARWSVRGGGEPCIDSKTVEIAIPGLDNGEVIGLSAGDVHEFRFQALDDSAKFRCSGGDFFETDLSGESWKSRPLVKDFNNGSYSISLQVHPDFHGVYNLTITLLYRHFEGLKFTPWRFAYDRVLRNFVIRFYKSSSALPELETCKASDFTRDVWNGRWTRHGKNDDCKIGNDGRYRCLAPDFPCKPPWCYGSLGNLESNGWVYSSHCSFKLFSADSAWNCLKNRWIFFWGDSNHVDTIRNILNFILDLPRIRSVPRRFDMNFSNPKDPSQTVRITSIFNGHWNETQNYLGLDSLRDEGFQNLLKKYFSEATVPDTMIMNSGLHDGVHWRNLRAFSGGAEYAASFWADVMKSVRQRGLVWPKVFYRATIATGGYARSLAFNPNKMEVYNHVLLEKLKQAGVVSGGVIDNFDMTFPWHFDNRCNDGVHYGRAPAKMKWRDGQIGHQYFVDLMLAQVLLNAICAEN
ncbi:uncharacterized protein G2W53_005713 [Senna tora]|uniref:RNase H type-1 domain-containing protein n=1 Tax=Senna tora TaxID=362788 RepID=A0A834X2S1_9FABA|nr:uncharacterized protein G2W53_005713 [Senna tora]